MLQEANRSNSRASMSSKIYYKVRLPGSFARITGVQGSFSNLGFGRPNYYLIGRFDF
jgi:hypothetical protein